MYLKQKISHKLHTDDSIKIGQKYQQICKHNNGIGVAFTKGLHSYNITTRPSPGCTGSETKRHSGFMVH